MVGGLAFLDLTVNKPTKLFCLSHFSLLDNGLSGCLVSDTYPKKISLLEDSVNPYQHAVQALKATV
ncbi:MAG: hypothetical protein C3F12_01440 [Candidatus Methylomirabilota bacterium]|nr:MAG: hypothetical protein C3F12_01440 [candidate division NC10 bacterium]